MIIAFTGHRNRIIDAESITKIFNTFPDAKWIHGGAVGFDSQIENFAKEQGIQTIVLKPDYTKYGRIAPHIRNRSIVDSADMVIACYDGRTSGGTYQTIQYARQQKKQVIIYAPAKIAA